MIKIENTQVLGFEAAVRGARNPMNSWDKSDSYRDEMDIYGNNFVLGPNDLDLLKRLSAAGPDHGKYLRMIHLQCDVTAPLYWWKEADTYKVGTVANSCSTMHKLTYKEFELDDFSHEHLLNAGIFLLEETIKMLNKWREVYIEGNPVYPPKSKDIWWQMIQTLPSSYNQRRTFDLNYAVLKNIYWARKDHKLDEWHTFCDWIKSLPYAEELICRKTGEGK